MKINERSQGTENPGDAFPRSFLSSGPSIPCKSAGTRKSGPARGKDGGCTCEGGLLHGDTSR